MKSALKAGILSGVAIFFLVSVHVSRVDASEDRITVIDGAGRTVTVSTSANLIVLITSQELFRLLGVEDRVVAVHRWVKKLHPDENPLMAEKPIVGGFGTGDVNYEKIIEIANRTPDEDLVITYAAPWAENVEQTLDGVEGIKVLKLKLNRMEAFDSQCELPARVVGRQQQWQRFQEWRNRILGLVRDRLQHVNQSEKPRVHWDASAEGHYDTVNDVVAIGKMIQLAGGVNIGEALPLENSHVSPEWILEHDPEIVISHDNNMFHLIGMRLGYSETDHPARADAVEKLAKAPGIAGTTASRRKKIYFIQDDLMSGPKQAVGVMQLAKWFYPEAFADISPETYHRDFYSRFMRLEYKGVHVYPFTESRTNHDSN